MSLCLKGSVVNKDLCSTEQDQKTVYLTSRRVELVERGGVGLQRMPLPAGKYRPASLSVTELARTTTLPTSCIMPDFKGDNISPLYVMSSFLSNSLL